MTLRTARSTVPIRASSLLFARSAAAETIAAIVSRIAIIARTTFHQGSS
jgi:hypothetical protein